MPKSQFAERIEAQMAGAAKAGIIPADFVPTPEPTSGASAASEPTSGSEQTQQSGKPNESPENPAAAEKLLAGKYKTTPDLEKGYNELLTYATTLKKENDTFRSQKPADPAPAPATPPADPARMTPGQPEWARKQAIKAFAEHLGVEESVVEPFAAALVGSSPQVTPDDVQKMVQKAIEPYGARAEAKSYLEERYPEAMPKLDEISLWLDTSAPQHVQMAVQALLDQNRTAGAYEHAILAYQHAHGIANAAELKAAAEKDKPALDARRASAGMPGTAAGGTPPTGVPEGQPSPEYLAKLREAYRNGDAKAGRQYRRLTLLTPQLTAALERVNDGAGNPAL